MKLRKDQVDKLAEGKATLVSDHSKPEMMDKVLTETFPNDFSLYNKYIENYYARSDSYYDKWTTINSPDMAIGELIPLADFFEDDVPVYQYPETSEERDQIVKELLAIDYKKKLPSELVSLMDINLTNPMRVLTQLIVTRDVYRQSIEIYKCEVQIGWGKIFSFQDKETAELFLSNFKEELEQVKHLIS